MSCITTNNVRCTKCCEVIHVPKGSWKTVKKYNEYYSGILKYWTRVSKRLAKKKNPYMFSREMDENTRRWLDSAEFYTCKALVKGVGCSIRDSKDHPPTCKDYRGGVDYSLTCEQDINIIARSSE